ncbi:MULTISPECIES: hypothetical protein [Bartonella]|uniref:Uncharacterized protein n=2 Tax=Bartonella TaxID=773 RepID=A0A5B9CWS4_9HYPH|nr:MULTISPECIES: hypothetical protein [Bartonella]QEE08587.1 hypothetical protein D1093_02785 [Bartonella kosoyi]QEE09473.1 hypothetical protein D1093_07610 [Bartonella kosoyi]CAK00776.1 hypothetical prophage protein [Bartonella tribocorum CIP 105476]CAK00935.1 hypothetical prophage protein [Bartonella tribocorum CIP 105476]
MARKRTQDDIELTEGEKEILQEIIMTYKSIKVMSRYTKWIVLIILLLALDFSRLIDAVENIFTQKPNIRL